MKNIKIKLSSCYLSWENVSGLHFVTPKEDNWVHYVHIQPITKIWLQKLQWKAIFTDLLADSVAVDDEEAAEEAPVDGGDVPLVCSEANANAIWKPAYKLLFCEDKP